MDELWQLKPIGYMKSVFHYKNGTPRQPAVCSQARGSVTVDTSVFNNPEHSLEGLEDFSHVWIVFLFHKNSKAHNKAKVKPPRLDGRRVGVFSTRSPHRPNAIGLTLATIDSIMGATVYLSGVDILDGTPILDLKPYIPHYDSPLPPSCTAETGDEVSGGSIRQEKEGEISSSSDETAGVNSNKTSPEDKTTVDSASLPAGCGLIEERLSCCVVDGDGTETREITPPGLMTDTLVSADPVRNVPVRSTTPINKASGEIPVKDSVQSHYARSMVHPVKDNVPCDNTVKDDVPCTSHSSTESDSGVKTPGWVKGSSVPQLEVRFTPSATEQLSRFSRTPSDPQYQLELFWTVGEVERAVTQVLNEDPRSVYRRHKCKDSLYFFSIDTVHVTAWFDDNIAEVLKIQPVSAMPH